MRYFYIIGLMICLVLQAGMYTATGCISGLPGAPPVCGGAGRYAFWLFFFGAVLLLAALIRLEFQRWKQRKEDNKFWEDEYKKGPNRHR